MFVRCLSEAMRRRVRFPSIRGPERNQQENVPCPEPPLPGWWAPHVSAARIFGPGTVRFVASSLLPILIACGGGESRPVDIPNNVPRVTRFQLTEERAHAAEDLHFSISAADDDGDELRYRWFATRGSFPFGRGQRSVVWRSPRTRGVDTVWVTISDLQDSIEARRVVELVLPEPPAQLRHVNSTSFVDVSWEPSPDENIENWVGYQVFYGTSSLVDVAEEELDPYLATPEPVREHLVRISGLVPGQKYWFHVRSVRFFDGQLERSVSTPEFHMSPRPEGPISGFGELTSSVRASFDLSERAIRPLDVSNPGQVDRHDFYLGTTGESDQGGALVLKSVSELADRNPAWASRVVQIKPIGKDWNVTTTSDEGWSTRTPVELFGVYAIKTPEGNYAKVWITGISRFPPERLVTFVWAYQTIPDYPSF